MAVAGLSQQHWSDIDAPESSASPTPSELAEWHEYLAVQRWRALVRKLILKEWARRCDWVARWWFRWAQRQGMMPAEFSDETNSEEDDMPQRDDDSDYDDDDRSVLARIEV